MNFEKVMDLVEAYEDYLETPCFQARLIEASMKGEPFPSRYRPLLESGIKDIPQPLRDAVLLGGTIFAQSTIVKSTLEIACDYVARFTNMWFRGAQASLSKADRGALESETLGFFAALSLLRKAQLTKGRLRPRLSTVLRDLIVAIPSGVPDFDGYELWAQRRAMIDLYDLVGEGELLRSARRARLFLWAYLPQRRRVSPAFAEACNQMFGNGWERRIS
jgi:hypothetical protein